MRRRVNLFVGLLVIVGFAMPALAAPFYFNGVLTAGDPTFHHPNASTVGTAVQHYDVFQFTVDTSGAYTFEAASPNTTGTPSNALDTFIALYATSFNPASPGAGQAFNDDFTGTLTVLPGPYTVNGVTTASTGFSGTQPGSRIATTNLVAGTQYFLVNTSFRSTDFVGTGTTAQPRGAYYDGINGPGNVIPVPEPASLGLLVLAGAGLLRRRSR